MPDPISAPAGDTGELVLLVLPPEAALVATGTPHLVWTLDHRKALALPAGAYLGEAPDTFAVAAVVHMAPAEALALAGGRGVTLRALDGRTAQARIPTGAEVREQYERAVADAQLSEAPVIPRMSSADAKRLVTPLDLAEIAAGLLRGDAPGTTRADRAAYLLRLATEPTPLHI